MERRKQLAEYIAENLRTPFKWGENDCCLFVARWLAKAGYDDMTAQGLGQYSGRFSARRRLKALGYTSIRQLADSRLQPTLKPILGDIAYFDRADALGICVGSRYSYFVDDVVGGIVALKNENLTFWSI